MKGIYKRAGSPYWWVRYSYQGRVIRESTKVTGKRQAEAMFAARKADIARGVFKLADIRPGPLFRDFAVKYLEHAKGYKRSWKRDELSLRPLCGAFGPERLEQITAWQVEKYKRERKDQVSPATVNRELACLKHLFTMAVQWSEAEDNPAKPVKLFREDNARRRFLSPEEEEALLEACSPGLRLVVLMALNTGMRQGEILALRWEDVDFARGVITVSLTKNGETRMIFMNAPLGQELQALKSQVAGERAFPKDGGNVRRAFMSACRRAGIERVRFHDLRHTFASNLVMAGTNLVAVQRLLGHKTIQMTMRYSHVGDDHMREAVEKLGLRRTSTKPAQWPEATTA